MSQVTRKLWDARTITARCMGEHGVWAGGSDRYTNQCWTRDFVLAVMPLLLVDGRADIVRAHLEQLARRQRSDGKIPILFLDHTWPFLKSKIRKSLKDRKMSFMLKRYLQGKLGDLTPGTRDAEIQFIIGMYTYAKATNDYVFINIYQSHIDRAFEYIETNLTLIENGLVIGCDWRDTMHVELGFKALLTNNALLYHAYCLAKKDSKTFELRERIREAFVRPTIIRDYRGAERFDPLGGALALLYGILEPQDFETLYQNFASVNSSHGLTIKCRHNPLDAEEKEVINRTDGVVVWPFVVGFAILALKQMEQEVVDENLRMRCIRLEDDLRQKMTNLEGFREWYDPATGKGYGEVEQLWSATLYIRTNL